MADSISKALGIDMDEEVIPPRPDNRYVAIIEHSDPKRDLTKDQIDDYELVRNTLRFVVKNGAQALKRITEIAEVKDEALPFDTVARLTKAVVDSTRELKELHINTDGSKTIKQDISQPATTQNIDKAVFIGTPNDLLKRKSR